MSWLLATQLLTAAPGLILGKDARTNNPGPPLIQRLGTIAAWPIGECTPIVFKGKLYRYEWVHKGYQGNQLGDDYSRIIDVSTGEGTAPFAKGYVFGSAFVYGGTVYVSATSKETGLHRDRIQIFASNDLHRWDSWTALDLPGFSICNTSICRATNNFVMMFEIDKPVEQAGVPFTARFATSAELRHWELTPPECVYAKDRYTAPHCLRYADGYFYDFYLEACPGWYETRLVRSKDLVHWEASPLNPVLRPNDDDKKIANPKLTPAQRERIAKLGNVNNSDMDLCEYQGKVIIIYCWGNQTDEGNLGEAFYSGSLEQFLKAWFPSSAMTSDIETKGGPL
ncbi:MAG: hypothetical protein M1608_18220 [Candidatus Omnitrophica bacterium]|nr:hypothetical protein [Candidatus Omnitrophota bacterium]